MRHVSRRPHYRDGLVTFPQDPSLTFSGMPDGCRTEGGQVKTKQGIGEVLNKVEIGGVKRKRSGIPEG